MPKGTNFIGLSPIFYVDFCINEAPLSPPSTPGYAHLSNGLLRTLALQVPAYSNGPREEPSSKV